MAAITQTDPRAGGHHSLAVPRQKVLFVVEGYTDIRFVVGLSEISDLTMLVPAAQYRASGLDERIRTSGANVRVDELPGGRVQYQFRSLAYLWRAARRFDLILSQEMLRGSLSACVVGALRKVPTVVYVCLPPAEYYRCRRKRGQVGVLKSLVGEKVIRALMTITGKLASRCVALGPYLGQVSARYSRRIKNGLYYGIDTDLYRPAGESERKQLRAELKLPPDKFLIFLPTRISHEKDPETVLRATMLARERGLDAVLINLGGGYQEFLDLAKKLSLPDSENWVLGRPAAHPMRDLPDYYRAADCMALASLSEGLGMSPLEALACGTPAVCTAVGGMAQVLPGYARLTPMQDAEAMAQELHWVAANRQQARSQALRGREYVIREWSRDKAFSALAAVFHEVTQY